MIFYLFTLIHVMWPFTNIREPWMSKCVGKSFLVKGVQLKKVLESLLWSTVNINISSYAIWLEIALCGCIIYKMILKILSHHYKWLEQSWKNHGLMYHCVFKVFIVKWLACFFLLSCQPVSLINLKKVNEKHSDLGVCAIQRRDWK